MDQEEEQREGAPEWMVTFGDMMSLLLTFFIMLISLSEVKQEERFQAMLESIRRQFGHDRAMASMIPGKSSPRNSRLSKLASMGRARRFNTMRGGQPQRSPQGDEPRVKARSPGTTISVGTRVIFDHGTNKLTELAKRELQKISGEIGGKPQIIEIRGHTSRRPLPPHSSYNDNWDLAYHRSTAVMEFLVNLGIEPYRMRLSVAGSYEPYFKAEGMKNLQQNDRVEVYLITDNAKTLKGSE